VRNVFDRAPPIDPADSKLMNDGANYAEPAFWYVRWSKEW
jgi:hypothetical protein